MKKILFTLTILLLSINILKAEGELEELTYEQDQTLEESVVTTDEENNQVKSSNKYFELELVRGVQNPITKEIPFTLHITPKIDSQRTQILWDIPTVFTIKTKHKEFVSLQKDITYKYEASVKPERAGAYDISVNVISWQYDTNRTNVVNYTVTLNKGLTVQPVDSEYTLMVILIGLSILLFTIVLTFVIVKLVKVFIEKLKNWLTPPF